MKNDQQHSNRLTTSIKSSKPTTPLNHPIARPSTSSVHTTPLITPSSSSSSSSSSDPRSEPLPSHHPTSDLPQSILRTYDSLLLAHQLDHPKLIDRDVHRSLDLIKTWLVGASVGGPDSSHGLKFISLQNQIELNASLVLLRWLSQISNHPSISSTENSTPSSHHHQLLIPQLSKAFVLLQGLLHLHPASQKLFSSKFNLILLLNYLPLGLYSPKFMPIALPLLDLLLMTFVDSPTNAQLFESAGGLEILIQAMKHKGLRNELRVKVLETLWGWWIDDEDGTQDSPLIPPSMSPFVHPSTKLNSAFDAHPVRRTSTSMTNRPTSSTSTHHNTPQTCSRPKSFVNVHQHGADVAFTDKTRGNSRIRPLSLPPPIHSENEPRSPSSSNLSDGHDTPKANKGPRRSQINPSVTDLKSTSKSKTAGTVYDSGASSAPRMFKSSSATVVPSTPSRHTNPSDPASRLRTMLENTAGEFIPATPQHPHRMRPMSPNDLRSPRNRHPHALHRSYPISQTNRAVPLDSHSKISSSESETASRPSDDSEDSDRLEVSPHQLFTGRPRRNQIQQAGNTPQRLIRHKQSASLGSIQHLSQAPASAIATQHRQSNEDDSGSGSEPTGLRVVRARDPTVRPLQLSSPVSSRPTTGLGLLTSVATTVTGPPHRPGSRLSRASSAETKSPVVESFEPKAVASDSHRLGRNSKPPSRGGVSRGSKLTSTGEASPMLIESRPSMKEESEGSDLARPKLSAGVSQSVGAPITPSGSKSVRRSAMTTPVSTNSKSVVNSTVSPNKRFISRPLTPNNLLINQSDLELIVNGTDSDIGVSIALSKKDKRKSLQSKKATSNLACLEDQSNSKLSGTTASPSATPAARKANVNPNVKSIGLSNLKHKKGKILEKYMSNSDQLVRSFKEIGVVGLSLLNHYHPHPPDLSDSPRDRHPVLVGHPNSPGTSTPKSNGKR